MGTQKVVIPKGLVNPGETTIVEIPRNLQNVGTVIARQRSPSPGSAGGSPHTPRMLQRRTYARKSWPKKKPVSYWTDDAATTWHGRPTEDSADESSHGFHPYIPTTPGMSTRDVSYCVGEFNTSGFDPPLINASTPQQIDDVEGSLYRDFRPNLRSSRRQASPPRALGRSMKKYHEPESFFKSEITTSSPEEVSTEITEEQSYYEDSSGDACPCDSSSGGQQFDSSGSSGGYQQLDSSGSGGYRRFDESSFSPPSGNQLSQRDVMNSLGDLEANELSQIMGDLSSFQNARRRLVIDASSLASASDVSSSFLS